LVGAARLYDNQSPDGLEAWRVWRFTMHGPDGVNYPNKIVFDEIVKPERLTYTHGSDEQPDQFRVTVTSRSKAANQAHLASLFPQPMNASRKKIWRGGGREPDLGAPCGVLAEMA